MQGILGHGTGKAAEAKAAVDKATRRALKHLNYVPRFRGHTIHYSSNVLFGKTEARHPPHMRRQQLARDHGNDRTCSVLCSSRNSAHVWTPGKVVVCVVCVFGGRGVGGGVRG